MTAAYQPLSVPRTDPTARDAMARVRDEGRGRLMVSIEAFARMAAGYYAVK